MLRMGAGKQRWWRNYEAECSEWSNRDVVSRTVDTDGAETTVYKDGRVNTVFDGIRMRLRNYLA
jgi:hypothetical protein